VHKHPLFKPVISRFLLILAISIFFTFLFNETSYLLLKEKSDRAPQTIQLVIPRGTALKIENGEENLSIPSEMIFVLGDVLEVKNNDEVSHQLGPIWVPPGATGSLVMEVAINLLIRVLSFPINISISMFVNPPHLARDNRDVISCPDAGSTSILIQFSGVSNSQTAESSANE